MKLVCGVCVQAHRCLVPVLTFLCCATYHASTKAPRIVKSVLSGSTATANGPSEQSQQVTADTNNSLTSAHHLLCMCTKLFLALYLHPGGCGQAWVPFIGPSGLTTKAGQLMTQRGGLPSMAPMGGPSWAIWIWPSWVPIYIAYALSMFFAGKLSLSAAFRRLLFASLQPSMLHC